MQTLISLVTNDLRKARKQKEILYLLIAVVLMLALPMAIVVVDPALLHRLSKTGNEVNLFAAFYLGQYAFISCFGIVATNLLLVFLIGTERENNYWKFLLALPVPYQFYVLSKLIVATIINLIMALVVFAVASAEGLVLPAALPNHQFEGYLEALPVLLGFASKFFLISMAVSSFHTLIHFFVNNRTLLILISVFMPIICLFDFASYLPYGWTMENFWLDLKIKNNTGLWNSILGTYGYLSAGLFLLTMLLTSYLKKTLHKLSNFYK